MKSRPESPGRQGARFGVRAAILGLIEAIPWAGPIATRILEDAFPSPREKEQAERIRHLEAQVRRLAPIADPRLRREQHRRYDSINRTKS
jgi:hypothetical protein